jgi:hypothetical protein
MDAKDDDLRTGQVEVRRSKGSPSRRNNDDAGTSGKVGAPVGNENALRHGLRSQRLGRKLEYIARQTIIFRRHVETAVLSARGEIGVFDAAVVQTSCEWLCYALKVKRLLRLNDDTLNSDQKVAYGKEVARAMSERDKALKMLGIHSTASASSMIYTVPLDDESDESLPAPVDDGGNVDGADTADTRTPDSTQPAPIATDDLWPV